MYAFAPVQRIDPPRVTIVTAQGAELWAAGDDEVEQAIRRDSRDDDAYLNMILAAARIQFEGLTGQSLVRQTLLATFDGLPTLGGCTMRSFELPRVPLVSVSSVKYLDAAGAEATFASSNYTVSLGSPGAFGRVALKPDASWPDLGDFPGALRVEFIAGHAAADAVATVPADLRIAVLWIAAWWYEERLPVNVGNIVNELPFQLSSMIERHRVAFLA